MAWCCLVEQICSDDEDDDDDCDNWSQFNKITPPVITADYELKKIFGKACSKLLDLLL